MLPYLEFLPQPLEWLHHHNIHSVGDALLWLGAVGGGTLALVAIF